MPAFPFRPILAGGTLSDRLLAAAGAAICLVVTALLCSRLPLQAADLPSIVAPLGASAVLVLAVPASPLAQPWPVIGGNTVSALVGVAVFHFVPTVWIAGGIAVGTAIVVMSLLRCLHPPGGAAALTAVIGGTSIHAAGFGFAIMPVAINSLGLVLLGIMFHRLTGRSFPHRVAPDPSAKAALHAADIDAALADMHESFDITQEDLQLLLTRASIMLRSVPPGAGEPWWTRQFPAWSNPPSACSHLVA